MMCPELAAGRWRWCGAPALRKASSPKAGRVDTRPDVRRLLLGICWLLALAVWPAASAQSLRFFGNGDGGIDRVTIPIDAPDRPADIGAADFTIEFWLRASPGENDSQVECQAGMDAWIEGNTLIDRDIWGAGDHGDFGASLMRGRLAFGLAVGSAGATACGTTPLDDEVWHHLALVRAGGSLMIFVDGQLDGEVVAPLGDASYRDGRVSGFQWDPYLVLGAEKHDAGADYPSFSGWLSMLRLSDLARYVADFKPPTTTLEDDGSTVALYYFHEGAGASLEDAASRAGERADGELRIGGSPAGPIWSALSPFGSTPPVPEVLVFVDGFEAGLAP